MPQHSLLSAFLLTAARTNVNVPLIINALIVAGVTASATGYVTAQVLQSEMGYLKKEIKRVDDKTDKTSATVDGIALRQAAVISQADVIHANLERRVEKIEGRK